LCENHKGFVIKCSFLIAAQVPCELGCCFKPGVKKRNGTERNGINGIFSETERNETENIWKDQKRKETKFKETKLKRKNNSVFEKKITKNAEKKFLPGNLTPIQINLF
jgi:hypothetical protein